MSLLLWLGTGGGFYPTIAPASDVESAASGSNTFAPVSVATVVPSDGTISYNWGFLNAAGGTWSISAGQGTANATVSVSGVAPEGGVATANLYCDVTRNGVTKRTNLAPYQFTNTTTDVLVIPNVQLSRTTAQPTNAQVAFGIHADGRWRTNSNGVTPNADQGPWITPEANAALYEARLTQTGGNQSAFTSGPAMGAFHSLGTDRNWVMSSTEDTDIIRNIIFTIEIRKIVGGTPSGSRAGNECYTEVQDLS